jgi:hypothetical protein
VGIVIHPLFCPQRPQSYVDYAKERGLGGSALVLAQDA